MLQALEDRSKKRTKAVVESKGDDNALWIRKIVATVSNRPLVGCRDRGQTRRSRFRFADVRRAAGGGRGCRRARSVARHFERSANRSRAADRGSARRQIEEARRRAEGRREKGRRGHLSFRRSSGASETRWSDFAQDTLYEGVLDTRIEGESNVPQHVNFIVAPNHTSHIDTGLGEKGSRPGRCGADRRGRGGRLLVRHEIQACVHEQLHDACSDRTNGKLAAIAAARDADPERGLQRADLSRRRTSGVGQIAEFKPIIGYLALNQKIGILPIYIWGTYEAFPKGTIIPKRQQHRCEDRCEGRTVFSNTTSCER